MLREIMSLQHLISTVITQAPALFSESADQYFQQVRQEAFETAERIRENMRNNMLQCGNNQQRRMLIHLCQRNFVVMADELASYQPPNVLASFLYITAEPSYLNLLKELYRCINELLNYIAVTFADYVNLNMAMPMIQAVLLAKKINQMLESIRPYIPDTNINENLSQLILEVATENMVFRNAEPYTFSRSNCLLAFLEEIRILVSSNRTVQRELHVLLCSYNLNHKNVIQYCIDTIARKVDAIGNIPGKIDKLALIRKRINQITYKDGHIYDEGMPDMKKQLNKWIDEEISYLEKRVTLRLDHIELENTGTSKIVFNLNLQELAFLLNVAEAVGMVNVRNKTHYLKVAAQMYATTNQDVIEPETLRTMYYRNNPAAMYTIRNKISDMLDEVNKRIQREKN